MVDLADAAGVPLTDLGADTVAAIEEVLDPELPAVNPLDAWSRGGETAASQMTNCLTLMMQDDGAALGAIAIDRAPDGFIYPSHIDCMRQASDLSGKPVALVASRQGTGCDPLVVATTHNGFPVVDGVSTFLSGVRGLMNYRDFLRRPAMRTTVADDEVQSRTGPNDYKTVRCWMKNNHFHCYATSELQQFDRKLQQTGNELKALAQTWVSTCH